jgi:hypothetical protein
MMCETVGFLFCCGRRIELNRTELNVEQRLFVQVGSLQKGHGGLGIIAVLDWIVGRTCADPRTPWSRGESVGMSKATVHGKGGKPWMGMGGCASLLRNIYVV